MGSKIKSTIIIFLLFLWVLPINNAVLALDNAQTQRQLEQELQDIEKQITELEQQLKQTQGEKKTLTNKINQLKKQQASLRLQIKATSLKIKDLNSKISATEKSIDQNFKKINRLKTQLADQLRLLNQKDREPLLLIFFTKGGLTEYFTKIENYENILQNLNATFTETRAVKAELEKQQNLYNDQQADAKNLLSLKTLQEQTLRGRLSEQTNLLQETQGKESNYQAAISDTKKRAAQIRNRIYELFNVGKQITFGDAVNIAEWIGRLTGIQPAFLSAVLTQESNLGKNVGTCNRLGDPPEKSWKVVMKPERDHEPFLTITKELGLNPDTTPVSCPLRDKNGKPFGWGGAMGPAQFIPSTWMGYKNKVANLTGKTPADPWDIRDALTAAAIKLKGDGANGTDKGHWNAAMKYFAGSINLKYRFYADNVLELAKQYEEDIADLKK
jgi:predicted  nucleic acid-binding Zn-ribbon protein